MAVITTKISESFGGLTIGGLCVVNAMKVYDTSQIKVYVDEDESDPAVENTDYTVAIAGDFSGCTVTTLAPLVARATTIAVARVTPLTSDFDITPNGKISEPRLVEQLDKSLMREQENADDFSRALRFPIGDTASAILPAAVSRASQLVGFDASGDLAMASPTGVLPGSITSPLIANAAIIRPKYYNHLAAYGSTGEALDDNSDAITAFFADVALGLPGHVGAGTHVFKAAVPPVVANNVRVSGDGPLTLLRYAGASATPGDLLTFGNGVDYFKGFDVTGFMIDSLTEITAGRAMRLRRISEGNLNVKFDPSENFNFFEALWLDESSIFDLMRSKILARSKAVIWHNGVELYCGAAYIKGKLVAGVGTGIGIHIAGNCGGFNSQFLRQLYNLYGVLVDTSLNVGVSNNQLFFQEGSTFDTNGAHALLLNDDAVGGSKALLLNSWMCSSKGHNVRVQKWTEGEIRSATGRFNNAQNVSSGLYYEENIYSEFGPAVEMNGNTAYAIDGSVPFTIKSAANPTDNALGVYGANASFINPQRGSAAITQDPALGWVLDATANTITIANGANAAIAGGSGLVQVANPNNGDVALYIVGGGGVQMVCPSTSGTWVAPTTTPGAGQCSVAFDGASAYRVYNNYGSSQAFVVTPVARGRVSI